MRGCAETVNAEMGPAGNVLRREVQGWVLPETCERNVLRWEV